MIDYSEVLKLETGTKITRQSPIGETQFCTIIDIVPVMRKKSCFQILSRDGSNLYHIDEVQLGMFNALMVLEKPKKNEIIKTYLERNI